MDILRHFIVEAPIAVAVFDSELKYVAASRRWIADFVGTDRVLAKLSHHEVFPDAPIWWLNACRRALAGQVARTGETFWSSGDGPARWLRWRMHPWRNQFGTVCGIVVFAEDITGDKTVKQELAVIRGRLVALLEAIERLQQMGALVVQEPDLPMVLDQVLNAAIMTTDAHMGHIQLFDEVQRTLKIVVHRGFEQPLLDFYNGADAGEGALDAALKRGERVIVEDVAQSSLLAGTRALDVQLRAGVRAVQSTPLIGRSGNLLGVISTHYRVPRKPDDRALQLLDVLVRQVADIIDRTRAAERLLDREAHLKAIIDTVVDGIIATDGRGIVLSLNPAAQRLFGYAADEVVGHNVSLLMPEPDRSAHDGYMARYASTGSPKVIGKGRVLKAQRKDGSTFPIELAINEARLGQSRLFVGIVRDITERMRMDAELERRHAELRRVNTQLDQFTYIISHDLRSPLRAMSNSAEWIIEDLGEHPSEAIRAHVKRISDYGARMHAMLDGLLAYARAGLEPTAPERVNLDELIPEIRHHLEAEASVVIEISGPVRSFHAARAAIELVLRNLIENAINHAARDDVLVRVSCEDDGTHLWFEVGDNGPGIAPEHQAWIFLPFRRLDQQSHTTGAGMGLALVKRMVEDNGGTISVSSNPALRPGAVFRFSWSKRPSTACSR